MIAMKYILCVAIVAVSLSKVDALKKSELSKVYAMYLPHIGECSKEYGLAEGALKDAKKANNYDSIDGCFFACVFKKAEIIDEKGMFSAEKATEQTKILLSSEEDLKSAAEIIEECTAVNSETVVDEDGCERAKLVLKCFSKNRDKFTINESEE